MQHSISLLRYLVPSLWLFGVSLLTTTTAQLLPTSLQKAHEAQQTIFPTEKIYVMTDRSLFAPRETVWLAAWVTNAGHLKSDQSQILFVELIDPKGNINQRININSSTAQFMGDIRIPHDAAGGLYKIRAYTNWIRNFGEDRYFEKTITIQRVTTPKLLMTLDFEKEAYSAGDSVRVKLNIREPNNEPLGEFSIQYVLSFDGKSQPQQNAKTLANGTAEITFLLPKNISSKDGLINLMVGYEGTTESISRQIPIVLNDVALRFFPEGGYLMADIKNTVAFEAVNEFGKPADIKGVVKNKSGETIAQLESFYQGLGQFEITPSRRGAYTVELTSPTRQTFKLPKTLSSGMGIRKIGQTKDSTRFFIHHSEEDSISLVAEMQGKAWLNQKIVTNGRASGTYSIATQDLPIGILKLTVFDAQTRPQVERLVFINQHRQLNIEIKTDKEQYGTRAPVQLNFQVTDETGKGVQGEFALAVVEDKQHTFIDDKQDNILSGLLMSSELRGKIHEPSAYFDPDEPKANQALDLVMMTKGWRNFSWRELMDNQNKWAEKVSYPKDVMMLTGQVILDGKLVKNATVYLKEMDSIKVKTDERGNFTLPIHQPQPLLSKRYGNTMVVKYRNFRHEQNINNYQFNYNLPSLAETNTVAVSIKSVKNNTQQVKVKKVEEEAVATNSQGNAAVNVVGVASAAIASDALAGKAQSVTAAVAEIVTVGYQTPSTNGLMSSYALDINRTSYWAAPNLYARINYNGRNFYASRYFYAPNYRDRNRNNRRGLFKNDFRKTLHWQPKITTNIEGKANINFYTSDENTTFRAIVEGISSDGQVGRAEHTFSAQSPVNIEIKAPQSVATGDQFYISILYKNNTDQPLEINLETQPSISYFQLAADAPKIIQVPASGFVRKDYWLDAGTQAGFKYLFFTFTGDGIAERRQQQIPIHARGFEAGFSITGDLKKMQSTYEVEIDSFEDGTLDAVFQLYPNSVSRLMESVQSMIRKPHGCFEQVSSTNYPNIFALQFMDAMDIKDVATRQKAKRYMSKAYSKLTGYECTDGGFDWYGESPADERLTAYGLLEFMDMKKVYSRVSQDMIDRTAAWLYNRRNGEGSYKHGRYWGYSRYVATHDAYVTYALSVHNGYDLSLELQNVTKEALESKDWYRLALAALSNWHVGNPTKAREVLDVLIEEVESSDAININTQNTAMYTYGLSRNVVTWSFILQALIQQERTEHSDLMVKILGLINQSSNGRSYFGSTQATVQALKAITQYVQYAGYQTRSGEVQIVINDQKTLRTSYNDNLAAPSSLRIQEHLKVGKNTIRVQFMNTEKPCVFSISASWRTLQPQSSPDCPIAMNTYFEGFNGINNNVLAKVNVGETIRLNAVIQNTASQEVYNPIALVSIPAGLSLQPWQLKQLQEEKAFDYYEIQDNYLVLYFRGMKASAQKRIAFDLKADMAGEYCGSANSAYLYYGAEDKHWQRGLLVSVLP